MNCLIGCATGYEWDKLWPFVVPARKNAPDVRIVLLTDTADLYTRQQLAEHDVCIVPVNTSRPWMPPYIDEAALLGQWRLPPMHIVCSRFCMMYAFLRVHGHEYEQVMLTDVRDALIASDPFAFPWDTARACVIQENEQMTMGLCPYNSAWMRGTDPAVFDAIKNEPIICSGVIAGRVQPVCALLEVMMSRFQAMPVDRMLTDQIVLRHIVHKTPKVVRVYGSQETPILHAGYFKQTMPSFEGKALLHQLDRFPAIYQSEIERLT